MTTQLNRRGTNMSTVQKVAASAGLQTEHSMNSNPQFKKEPLQLLYELAVGTLFGKDTFYRSASTMVSNLKDCIRQAVSQNSLDFVANVAVHARTEMNIRTIPIVIVVEFANELRKQGKSYSHMRKLVCDVIQRADQITDMYAYALEVFGDKKAIPTAIKRGVGDAFNKYNEYQFAKYNRSKEVKFRDVLRMVHPVAKNTQQGLLFDKIMKEQLETPYTWETELSTNGQLPESDRLTKTELWSKLVQSGKMGYMALLRNLRNIHEAGVPAHIVRQYVLNVISNPERVKTSKQLTFDFLKAHEVVRSINNDMATAVETAVDISTNYLPKLGDRVWIIVDRSASMGGAAVETALTLASALVKANNDAGDLAVTMFGSTAETIKLSEIRKTSVLSIKATLATPRVGGSTNFRAALNERSKLGFVPDTIVVFTDGEINLFPYSEMNEGTNTCSVKIVTNLHAATSTPFISANGWWSTSGWSPAMFKWIPAIRQKNTIVDLMSVPYIGTSKIESLVSDDGNEE